MDKIIDSNSLNHIISVTERKSIIITGIKKIENFDNEQFLLNSSFGLILLKGNNLEIIKLDTTSGNVSIRGKIDSIEYLEENQKTKKENNFFNKLFKWALIFNYYQFYFFIFLVYYFQLFIFLLIIVKKV